MMLFAVEFGPVSFKKKNKKPSSQTQRKHPNPCEMSHAREALPVLERSAGRRATPRGPLPPWSAEPGGRPAAAPLPVCGTGRAPAPSAGRSPPLQEDGRPSIISIWTRGGAGRSSTSHLVHGGDQLAQSVHQSSVLHRASFLQTQLLPLSFASIL